MVEPRIERPEFRGSQRDFWIYTGDEAILSGAAGTGKTVVSVHRIHYLLCKYPGARILMCRKTARALTTGALATYEKAIVNKLSGRQKPKYFGGSHREPAGYRYANGSRLVIGGLDKASKVLSSEYDGIYVNEANEATLADWEYLTTRLRSGVIPFQQIWGDTNPDAPYHWIKKREGEKKLRIFYTRHEENPSYFDAALKTWTEAGKKYLDKLAKLSGVRRLRFLLGQWAAADGLIYEDFDPAVHVISIDQMPRGWQSWRRAWALDLGFKNPFVWQDWRISPDGDAYMVREIYHRGRIVQDHARQILGLTGREMIFDTQGRPTGRYKLTQPDPEPMPEIVIMDHDAEDRATFEAHTGLKTTAAHKLVKPGIAAFTARLRPDPDLKRPRIFFIDTALVERDEELFDERLPICTVDEFSSYVWAKKADGKEKEEPKKEGDHGMDAGRYFVAWLDKIKSRGRVRLYVA